MNALTEKLSELKPKPRQRPISPARLTVKKLRKNIARKIAEGVTLVEIYDTLKGDLDGITFATFKAYYYLRK